MLINTTVSDEIFSLLNLNSRFEKIFEEVKDEFEQKFNEIKKYMIPECKAEDKIFANYQEISLEDVLIEFKKIFLEKISIFAVQNLFLNPKQNLEQSLIEELTIENVRIAIAGETMIDAFSAVIRKLPKNNSVFTEAMKGSTILKIRREFLGQNPFENLYSNN